MEDEDFEAEHRIRRGRLAYVTCSFVLAVALLAGGAFVNAQAPVAVALQPVSAAAGPPDHRS